MCTYQSYILQANLSLVGVTDFLHKENAAEMCDLVRWVK